MSPERSQRGQASRREAPPPWPDADTIAAAVTLFDAGLGLVEHQTQPRMFAPSPSEEYRELLLALEGPYRLRVRCGRPIGDSLCNGPLGWWRMEYGAGVANVHFVPSRPEDRNKAPRPWTAA